MVMKLFSVGSNGGHNVFPAEYPNWVFETIGAVTAYFNNRPGTEWVSVDENTEVPTQKYWDIAVGTKHEIRTFVWKEVDESLCK